jgi:hypothetical protein
MKSKTLIVAATMMIVATAHGSTIESTEYFTTLQESEAFTGIPDNEQIITDLIGHQMYVSEGLPGIWEFSSPADIQFGSIAGSRWDGDSMEFDFILNLVDNGSSSRDIYRAKTLVTYKKENGSWRLVKIQDLSFKATGTVFSIVPGNDC